jgi:hypothetical protein
MLILIRGGMAALSLSFVSASDFFVTLILLFDTLMLEHFETFIFKIFLL